MTNRQLLALDIGEKRIGVAIADAHVKIAIPYATIEVDGNERNELKRIISFENIGTIVVGYPRNQSGDETAQTEYVKQFTETIDGVADRIVYQDESLTSVLAEQRLKNHNKPYTKADIDSMAASIILQDYLEAIV